MSQIDEDAVVTCLLRRAATAVSPSGQTVTRGPSAATPAASAPAAIVRRRQTADFERAGQLLRRLGAPWSCLREVMIIRDASGEGDFDRRTVDPVPGPSLVATISSVVVGDDSVRDRQPQPGPLAVATAGEKRLEQMLDDFLASFRNRCRATSIRTFSPTLAQRHVDAAAAARRSPGRW